MRRTRSSHTWLREHVSDPYVQRARAEGYRSRAAYKLIEIDDRDHLVHPGDYIVDLGASPGGWSQVAAERLQSRGAVIALDVLPMEPLPGVIFLRGDFAQPAVLAQLEDLLAGQQPALVLSDLSPNLSGIAARDQARSLYLGELALAFASRWLKPGGAFLVKVFQGDGSDRFMRQARASFATVCVRKPGASRDRSPEIYLLARNPIPRNRVKET